LALSLSGLFAAHCRVCWRAQDLHDGFRPREVIVNSLIGKVWLHFVHVFTGIGLSRARSWLLNKQRKTTLNESLMRQ
jgi:hypothetical protein